jgi:hypothetical protein
MRPSFAAPNVLDQQIKTQRDDNEGWITSQRAMELPNPNGPSRIAPPTDQDGGMVTLSTEGQRRIQGTNAIFNTYTSIIKIFLQMFLRSPWLTPEKSVAGRMLFLYETIILSRK